MLIEIKIFPSYNQHVMRINKLTPLERAAKALFKNTIGNDLGKKWPYLTNDIQTDMFVHKDKVHIKSINRRKW